MDLRQLVSLYNRPQIGSNTQTETHFQSFTNTRSLDQMNSSSPTLSGPIPFYNSYPIPQFVPHQIAQQQNYGPTKISKGPPKFFCEPCEKGFQTQLDYSKHCEKHLPCEELGCDFKASRSGLQIHHLRVHNLRIRDLLKTIDTPEGLERYKEERRKNFPTKANIEKKKKKK